MHVTVTRTKDYLGQPIEDATLAGQEMLRWLEPIDGFEGLLVLSNEADGTTLVLTFWQSREVAEEHLEARVRLRERVTSAVRVEVQEATDYEVTFAELPRALRFPEAGS